MITVNQNPITHRYDRSPSEKFAAVRLADEVFRKVTGPEQKDLAEGPVRFSDGGYGRMFAFQVPGRKTPLVVLKRIHKASEADAGPRTMFYVKHEDVPETAEETELKTGARQATEVDF